MNSRERLQLTLDHKQPDRVPVDIGATIVSGISAATLMDLRDALKLEKRSVKFLDPFFMIAKCDDDFVSALDIDVVGVYTPYTKLGYKNTRWKEWEFKKNYVGLVGTGFNVTVDSEGNIYAYPQGDLSAAPSAMMPKDGYYFDNIVRQGDISDENLDARNDFRDQFGIYPEEDLRYIQEQADYYFHHTESGMIGNFTGTSLGDFSSLPGPGLKLTPGIRDATDWLVAHLMNPSYIKEVFDFQTEVAMQNLKLYQQAVGSKIQAVYVSGTDFGTQNGEFISPDAFREIYKPFFTKINAWIHENTSWKTFYHSCGSIANLLDDFVEMGVDILNPVQYTAKGMDARELKAKYGDRLVFWGGGMDTQKILPFGTPEEVYRETIDKLEIFSRGGGYVFNTVHNIQANTPVENLIAMFSAVRDFNAASRS